MKYSAIFDTLTILSYLIGQEYDIKTGQTMAFITLSGTQLFHSFNQIITTNKVKLFRSHRDDYKDGQQMRDFVYVKDVVDVLFYLMTHKPQSSIYNLGSGKARSFYDLASATFSAMGKESNIEYIDIPIDIRDKYQYFTEASMKKLKSIGYDRAFYSLEDGVKDYVQNYLIKQTYF